MKIIRSDEGLTLWTSEIVFPRRSNSLTTIWLTTLSFVTTSKGSGDFTKPLAALFCEGSEPGVLYRDAGPDTRALFLGSRMCSPVVILWRKRFSWNQRIIRWFDVFKTMTEMFYVIVLKSHQFKHFVLDGVAKITSLCVLNRVRVS